MKKLKFSSCEIEVKGVNLHQLLNKLQLNKIAVYNIKHKNHKCILFSINAFDYNKMISLNVENYYNVKIVRPIGIYNYLFKALSRAGLAVGFALTIALYFLFHNFVFDIQISGNNYVNTQQVINVLSQNGIKKNQLELAFSQSKTEKILLNSIKEFSQVSVERRGTTIFINVKERILQNAKFENGIFARENGTITKMELISGTALVKVGDKVKQGQKLVEPFFINSAGEQIKCAPLATITAVTTVASSVEFDLIEVKYIPTGNKKETGYLTLFSNKILLNQKVPNYEFFTVEDQQIQFSDFLPITYCKSTYFECQIVKTVRDFNANRELQKKQARYQAYQHLKPNDKVVSEQFDVKFLNNIYTTTCSLLIEIDIIS